MDIYILRDGKEMGPFTEETTQQLLKEGNVLIQDLAWRPGMPQWIPLHSVLYPAPPPPPPRPQAPPADPATAKQKAFLSYMGIQFGVGLTKEQAALLVNDAMENPKDPVRLKKWNDERLRLHPELFTAEIQAKKEGRAQHYFEATQKEGSKVFEGVTRAHCQVLVGYLDVKHPGWDSNEEEATWNYFFPAVGEKFPQLVNKEWRKKLKYPDGPKVSKAIRRNEPALAGPVSAPRRRGPSPIAALAKGIFTGVILLAIAAGGLYLWQHPELLQLPKPAISLTEQKSAADIAALEQPIPPPAPPLGGAAPDGSTPAPAPGEAPAPDAGAMAGAPASADGSMMSPAGDSSMAAPSMFDPNTSAANMTPPAPEATGMTPAPAPGGIFDTTPAVAPQAKTTVRLTKPVDVQLAFGKVKLNPGMTLKIISQEGPLVKVNYLNSEIPIPISSTDLAPAP